MNTMPPKQPPIAAPATLAAILTDLLTTGFTVTIAPTPVGTIAVTCQGTDAHGFTVTARGVWVTVEMALLQASVWLSEAAR